MTYRHHRTGYQYQSPQWAVLVRENKRSILNGWALLCLIFLGATAGVFGFAYLYRAFTGG